MQEGRKKNVHYYRIRASLLWSGIVFAVIIMCVLCFGERILERWKKSQEWISISYEGLQSELEDVDSCYLCGNSNQSLMGYFRKFDTIGLILLNDWYILEFKLKSYDEQEEMWKGEISGNRGNTGEVTYISEGVPSRGMASIDVTLPENYGLDTTVMQEHLCQNCLDKITATLHFSKWKYEKKNVIPLCLVDFATLEIYSLQEGHVGRFIRDYWVEADFRENEIEAKAFYLPER